MGQPIKSDDLFVSWSRGQWKSIYLFAGEEDFLIDQAIHQASRYWLGKEDSGFGLDRFDADEAEIPEILEACRTIPFMGSGKVVRIDNAAKLTAADQEVLAECLQTLPPETKIICVWGKEWRRDDARKPLVEKIQDIGQVVIFWPLFPEQAHRWLMQRARHYKKDLDPEAAGWLIQQTGESLRLLDQELAKSSIYTGGRPTIGLEDAQASYGYHKASSPFDWLSAIRRRNVSSAAGLISRLLEEGEEPLRLLALLSRSIRDWLNAKSSGNNASMMGMRFHIKRGEEHRFIQELNRWSEADLMEGIGLCLQMEQAIKTGKETPDMALTLLTLGLCGAQAANVLGQA